ncbi:DUF305 domain-containing protein [Amycolatopsis nigrescens]|uniref:DUF305 domain-containing protein n=1 Tax=Amycolatopsis nigrescens TaxID=381445 RepID=UPI0003680847|nr:DUF305 domain-containing protein [Amycolatopsis nigrescens]
MVRKNTTLSSGVLVTAAALMLAGCAGSDAPGAAVPDASPPSPGVSGFNPVDVAFATQLIPHHQQALEIAAHAGAQAVGPGVKAVAARIEEADEPQVAELSKLLENWGQPAPEDPGIDHGSPTGKLSETEVGRLRSATGAEFDRLFAELMIKHHQGSVSMANKQIAEGVNPEAVDLARRVLMAQQAEIAELEKLRTG